MGNAAEQNIYQLSDKKKFQQIIKHMSEGRITNFSKYVTIAVYKKYGGQLVDEIRRKKHTSLILILVHKYKYKLTAEDLSVFSKCNSFISFLYKNVYNTTIFSDIIVYNFA